MDHPAADDPITTFERQESSRVAAFSNLGATSPHRQWPSEAGPVGVTADPHWTKLERDVAEVEYEGDEDDIFSPPGSPGLPIPPPGQTGGYRAPDENADNDVIPDKTDAEPFAAPAVDQSAWAGQTYDKLVASISDSSMSEEEQSILSEPDTDSSALGRLQTYSDERHSWLESQKYKQEHGTVESVLSVTAPVHSEMDDELKQLRKEVEEANAAEEERYLQEVEADRFGGDCTSVIPMICISHKCISYVLSEYHLIGGAHILLLLQ